MEWNHSKIKFILEWSVKLRFLRAQTELGAQISTAITHRAPGSGFSKILRGFHRFWTLTTEISPSVKYDP